MKKLPIHIFLVLIFLISIAEARNNLLTYISNDNGNTWSQKITEIKNLSTKGAVDPSPILLKNGDILLYVLGSNVTSGDPGKSQPDNTWRMIVARSTDNGESFEEVGVAYSQKSNMTDPFIVLLPSNEFRLYLSKGASVFSATSKDGITFEKDKGFKGKRRLNEDAFYPKYELKDILRNLKSSGILSSLLTRHTWECHGIQHVLWMQMKKKEKKKHSQNRIDNLYNN